MDAASVEALRGRFEAYAGTFSSRDPEVRENLSLKEKHTYEVCRNIVLIGRSEGLDEGDLALAEAIALLHDIGRFPQFFRFRTFRDGISVNHGELGAKVARDEGFLGGLIDEEARIVSLALRYHNAFSVPGAVEGRALMFLKLIRDADKLDVWEVLLQYYGTPEEMRYESVGRGLPDTEGISEEALSILLGGSVVPLAKARNLNDLKLVQLSWIYNLNFRGSMGLAAERDIIGRYEAQLPRTEGIEQAIEALKIFVSCRIR